MVGPPHVKDPKPLPPDLEEFLSMSGGHGFVIVSFGSNVASNLDKPVVDMLATAFGKLKQRVVWRLKGNSGVKQRNYFLSHSVGFSPGSPVSSRHKSRYQHC